MYYLEKTLEIAGSHRLDLDYESKCANMHGHNWIITVYCKAAKVNHNGMVVDFTDISKVVMIYDHKNLNDLLDINPTAENMAYNICHAIPSCYKVKVQESAGNSAIYQKDGV